MLPNKVQVVLLLCFQILFVWPVIGQDLTLKGVITDSKMNPVSYAHVFVADSMAHIYLGTVSDLNGNFSLLVPDHYQHLSLAISCIGFDAYSQPVKEAKPNRSFVLTESNRMLSTVIFKDVSAKELIKKGIDQLSENYMRSTFVNQYFSWRGLKMDTAVVDFQEQYLTIEETFTAHKGSRKMLADTLVQKKSSPEIVEAETIYGLADNLYFDLIKSGSVIFNEQNFNDWEFSYVNSVDLTNSKDVVIHGNRRGRKGFNQLTFYLDVENFAFKRIDFSYAWDDNVLNKRLNDSLYYNINPIQFIYQFSVFRPSNDGIVLN